MFVRPENWSSLSAAERRAARFARWMSTQDKQFETPEAEATYRKHCQRLADVIALKKPDRVPITAFFGTFFVPYSGFTLREVMYDYGKYKQAFTKFVEDFMPDYQVFSGAFNPGRMFDALDYKVYTWPGHGSVREDTFQTIEKEYMNADEYDQFIADPESFYMRVYMPRAFGALAAWQMIPSFFATMEFPMAPAFVVPIGIPEVQQAFEALLKAGREALEWAMVLDQTEIGLRAKLGLPRLPGGFTKAPFDIIGDTLRGTRGIMLDLYRQPKKVLAACERLVPIAVQLGVQTATVQDNPFVFIPLHKGADDFMSDADYKKFYWPTHKAVILGLIEEGFVPYHLVEGSYNHRLHLITDPDIPAASTYWNFDRTDMVEVKKHLGGWACFSGNVSGSLLYTCRPEQVRSYVKELIDKVAQDGGFALATGLVVDHAMPDNLHAMFTTCKEYGVYRQHHAGGQHGEQIGAQPAE
jgi:uroporphyrinogen-III decarboxylase